MLFCAFKHLHRKEMNLKRKDHQEKNKIILYKDDLLAEKD